jgi:hypothetical protein
MKIAVSVAIKAAVLIVFIGNLSENPSSVTKGYIDLSGAATLEWRLARMGMPEQCFKKCCAKTEERRKGRDASG